MPTAESNKSRYVIPDDLSPVGRRCVVVPVPDDPQWIAQFLGAIWRMSLQTHYERDEAKSGAVVAARWREVWNEVQMALCGCGAGVNITTINTVMNFRFNVENVFIASGLNGVAPDRPDDKWDADTGDAGDEIQERKNALCLAAIDYVNTIADDSWRTAISMGISGLPAVFDIGWQSTPIGGIIYVGALALLTKARIDTLNDPDVREKVACCLRDALAGAAITEASFNTALAGCGFGGGTDEEFAREVIEASMQDQTNWLFFVRSLSSYFLAASAGVTDCPCDVIELEINPGRTFTTPMVLTYLGSNRWEVVAGIWDHPTAGPTDIADVTRVGGGCFDIEATALISGDMSRTSWTDCGGGTGYINNPLPQTRANKEQYQLQDIANVDGFVVRFDAVPA